MREVQQYVVKPPAIPEFLFRSNVSAWVKMVEWANEEFQARTVYLTQHGYWRELQKLNRNWSAIRILAEMSGYRRLCAKMTDAVWNSLPREHRRFIRKAFELRELLLRQNPA